MALAGVSQVMAASISSDDYIYSGSGVSIPLDEDILPSTGSFAISYELVGLTLNDVIGVAGTFFKIEIGTFIPFILQVLLPSLFIILVKINSFPSS